MAYVWNPEPGELVSVRDDSVSVIDETVEVTGDPNDATTDPETGEPVPPPDPNQFEVSGLDPIFTFTTQDNTFTIFTDQVPSIFPVDITYLLTRYEDSQTTVTGWDNVPSEAEEIIKMETTESSPYTNTFDVTASVDGDDPETVTYSIEVIHVYTANKDTLQQEVQLRS